MSATDSQWFHRRGALARERWDVVVEPTPGALQHAGLRVATLGPDEELTLDAPGVERLVVPLAGSFHVRHRHDGADHESALAGRASVFDGPTDVLYLPADSVLTLGGEGRVAVAEAPARERRDWQLIPAERTPTELRGAGVSSRQVHNFGTPQALDAVGLIVCEVITPAGNWSSYPPHKHDENVPGHESRLEEIYYFESAPARDAGGAAADAAFGLFSTYSSPAGSIEIDAMVRTGDVALVPYGYHGPAVAAPGYDLYYLNVMAGPDPERVWLISDDPAHAWARDTWETQPTDPRLPFTPTRKGQN